MMVTGVLGLTLALFNVVIQNVLRVERSRNIKKIESTVRSAFHWLYLLTVADPLKLYI